MLSIQRTSLATGRKPINGKACKGFSYPVKRVCKIFSLCFFEHCAVSSVPCAAFVEFLAFLSYAV
eukprot:TRINITY_DN4027_c0_g1_i1.p1 TRINITY_DN4027_c0_g1~~TRINITY_DN4027_c0_g1_i1.p1  ORF type:complete len:65 (-),score=2.57 TRINITY_DN4027_c0_g1_i1:16-210(-)